MTSTPTFSVVVPTHARPTSLHRCLDALGAIDFQPDQAGQSGDGGGFEVIVVVDGEGPTADALNAPAHLDLRLVQRPHRGPAATRNHGAETARGRWLAFVDDDCTPRPDWLTKLHARLVERPDALVGGRTINALREDLYAETTQLMVDELIQWECDDSEDDTNQEARAGFLPSCNLAVSRAAFRALGGFDETFPLPAGEDRDFCDRWSASGGRSIFAPEAIVEHHHHMGLASFWRQHARYGRGAYALRRRRAARCAAQPGPGTRLETPGFYRRLLTAPFAGRPAGPALGVALRMVLAQAATTFGFAREALSTRKR